MGDAGMLSWYLTKSPGLTQSGDPSMGRQNKYWRQRVAMTRKPCYRKDDRAMRPIAYMTALRPQLIFPTF